MGFCLFVFFFFFCLRNVLSYVFSLCLPHIYRKEEKIWQNFTLFTLEWEKPSFIATWSCRGSMSSTWNVMEIVNQRKGSPAQCSLLDTMLVLLLSWGNSWVSQSLLSSVTLGIPSPCGHQPLPQRGQSRAELQLPTALPGPVTSPADLGPHPKPASTIWELISVLKEAELTITIKRFAEALDPISDPYSLCKFNVLKRTIIISLLFLSISFPNYISPNSLLYYILNGWKLT